LPKYLVDAREVTQDQAFSQVYGLGAVIEAWRFSKRFSNSKLVGVIVNSSFQCRVV
jgi:hypothetical protein